jgi:hypothetical protein
MDELVKWLREQLDEDERIANAVGFANIETGEYLWESRYLILQGDAGGESKVTTELDGELAEHVARHDPARVLREIEAKREALAHFERIRQHTRQGGEAYVLAEGAVSKQIQIMATAYADRPGYREEWRPS